MLLNQTISIINCSLRTQKRFCQVPYTKLVLKFISKLYSLRVICNYFIKKRKITITLPFPAPYHSIRAVSTCGSRVYSSAVNLNKFRVFGGITILTTSCGIFTSEEALLYGCGGEVLAVIK